MLQVILFLIGVAALVTFSWRVRFVIAYMVRRLLRTMNGNGGRRRIVWG